MPPNFLRLAYVSEFLLALLVALELWSQVGGQAHLDLMPWYTKLGLTVGLAVATVAGTAAAVSHPDAWNAKTLAWLILVLLIAVGMAGVTYYYHLHESDDEGDGPDDPGVARLMLRNQILQNQIMTWDILMSSPLQPQEDLLT
jgi:acyl-CoA synthetase (AMP-forming)/AMP-acid ligase II